MALSAHHCGCYGYHFASVGKMVSYRHGLPCVDGLRGWESNPLPPAYETGKLPVLYTRNVWYCSTPGGGLILSPRAACLFAVPRPGVCAAGIPATQGRARLAGFACDV